VPHAFSRAEPPGLDTDFGSFGLDFNSAFLPYGDRWRFHRKLFHQTFRSTAVQDMHPLLLRKAHCLAKAIVESPDECLTHLQVFVPNLFTEFMSIDQVIVMLGR
jgi:cytochrome P450